MSQIPNHKRGLYLGTVPERAAAKHGATLLTLDHDLDALPGAGRRLTVAEMAVFAADLANRLSAAGVRAGEHVVVYKRANFDAWLLATAAARLGAIPVLLSPALPAPTVAALLRRLHGPHRPHLLTDGAKLAELAGLPLDELATSVIGVAGAGRGVASLARLAGSPPVPPVYQGLDEPAMITHTSGTTGVPKLVVHTPRTMRARLRPQLVLLALLRRRETVAVSVPFVHSRLFAAMSLVLMKGMPTLLLNNNEPADVAKFFLKNRPGLIEALPNSFLAWEGLADDPRRPLASVKYFSSTFDAIHPRTVRRLLDASRRRTPQFFQIYGQSEVGPAVGRPYFRRDTHGMDGRCVGFPLPGSARVRVVPRNDRRVSATNPGFIEVRWDGIAKTYHGEQERYDENVHDGWWRTGDVGYRTRAGCLHMLDREIDTIPGVGSSLEIEDAVLDRLDELVELVVVQGPDAEPVPVLCTRDDKPLAPARWQAATADYPQLGAPVHLPLAELPRTATLKTRRVELSRLLHDRL
ncbi:AMP-binding protein [Streptomyces sp. NBC_01808]|uniref:class I adenylate-forming enzyme family protein n=1 Tax=Streptomyces sp. NBC_01808 TaxID=2975947 RepID=UPI002DDC0EBC|nr:AMP-binding protein [Streptomyces sp. NBC_01808]WSA37669.1 AMP-binding protein [Streptomyces sp. NBC_01808]